MLNILFNKGEIMFRELKDIVKNDIFKITIYDNKIYINNYEDILIFEEELILLKIKNKILKITGTNLTITRLELNEMLVEGQIKSIDLGD